MNHEKSSEFGHEAKRTFLNSEHCYDCAEFYDGCNAWPASRRFCCADYLRLPDVMPGTCGQIFPPSRMEGRKEPRAVQGGSEAKTLESQSAGSRRADSVDHQSNPESKSNCPSRCPRTPSPAASYGPDGERLCECGVTLKKRQRCCETCRQKRREATLRRRRSRKPPLRPLTVAQTCRFLLEERTQHKPGAARTSNGTNDTPSPIWGRFPYDRTALGETGWQG
jgi:hypothetical protein